MNVSLVDGWKLPGCSLDCRPRIHDPHAHEVYGLLTALRTPPVRTVRTGPLVVDLDARTVAVHGQPVAPSAREWQLLAYLAERVGQLCHADDVITGAWGPEYVTGQLYANPGGYRVNADHRHLRSVVSRLRRRLGAAGRLIATVTSRGYRLEQVGPTP